mgnify:CR=1 FL=1
MAHPLRKVCLLIIVLVVAACSTAPQATPEPTATPEWMGEYEQQTVRFVGSGSRRVEIPETSGVDLAKLVDGNNAFTLDLYHTLSEAEGNLFFSPYSISLALAMAYAGARGETEQQMADVLHYTLSQERLHPAFNALDQLLARRGKTELQIDDLTHYTAPQYGLHPSPRALDYALARLGEEATPDPQVGYQLDVANAAWGQEGYDFLPEYLGLLAENYGAGLRLLDFKNAPDACRLTINQWVSDKTRGRIPDLLPPGFVDSLTRLVLTNAIYFDASWAVPFDPDQTEDRDFHLLDGGKVRVPMMTGESSPAYYIGSTYTAVELWYADMKTSALVVMPDGGLFEHFQRSLDTERLDALLLEVQSGMQSGRVILTMPSFEFASEHSLAETLARMGMPFAFSEDRADFSGMTGSRELLIDDVVHKAWVSVDEEGTEAAAATAVEMVLVSPPLDPPKPVEITIDHPFIFIIRDTETGTILFMGRVLDPSH